MAKSTNPIEEISDIEPIRFTEKIELSISRLYKIGGLGLVFIFLGFILMLFGFLNPTGKLSIPMFTVGGIMLLCSFIIFVLVQYRAPIKTRKIFNENKEVIDEIQDLSIILTKLTYNLQSYCFKNIDEIKSAASTIAPIIRPFLGENGNKIELKIDHIASGIIEFSNKTELLILNLKKALENGDVDELSKYSLAVKELNSEIQRALSSKEEDSI